jgi:hypothetical protein
LTFTKEKAPQQFGDGGGDFFKVKVSHFKQVKFMKNLVRFERSEWMTVLGLGLAMT